MKAPKGWNIARLDQVCDKIMDGTHFSPTSKAGPFKYLTSKNIRYGYIDLSNLSFISEEEHRSIYARCPVRKGDLLLTKDGANTGNAALNTLIEEFSLLSSVAVLRAKPSLTSNRYLLQTLLSPIGQALIESEISGQAITRLTLEKISGLRILVPPLPEQQKIAAVLGAWDEALEKLDALIAAKYRRKKALRQQLLSGKHRLPNRNSRWTKRTLGELIEPIVRPTQKPTTAFLAAGIRSHGRGVFLKPAFEPCDIALDELFQIKKDDLIVNITFAWEGAVAIVPPEADGALVSHRFPIFRVRESEAAQSFLRHYILTQRFVFDCGLASPGGAGRNRVLSKTSFLEIELSVPSAAEQQAIGSILDDADTELRLLRRQRAALGQQKRGLMQQLLTGKIRMKP